MDISNIPVCSADQLLTNPPGLYVIGHEQLTAWDGLTMQERTGSAVLLGRVSAGGHIPPGVDVTVRGDGKFVIKQWMFT